MPDFNSISRYFPTEILYEKIFGTIADATEFDPDKVVDSYVPAVRGGEADLAYRRLRFDAITSGGVSSVAWADAENRAVEELGAIREEIENIGLGFLDD